MEQLNFFEAMGVKVWDAAENKRKAAPKPEEQSSEAAPVAQLEAPKPKPKELAPTWEVHFFDKDGAQRIAWYRAKDEDNAKVKCKGEYGKTAHIFYTTRSKRTLEEIEALD